MPILSLFTLGCVALAGYYLVFVFGWMRILADWDIHISYPAALRAEMVSMLAKYVPGGFWTPAARVVAARRAGITDAGARDRLDPRRGRHLGGRRRDRLRDLARLGQGRGRPDRAARRVRGRRRGPAAPAGLPAARAARAAPPRPGELPPLPALDDGVPAPLLFGTWVIGGVALWLLLRSRRRPPERRVDRLPRRRGRGRGDRGGARRLRTLGPRPPRGVDVRADARNRRPGRRARRHGAEPGCDHAWSRCCCS